MSTFKLGATACKNGEPRTNGNQFSGIERNQWLKGWDWEHFNPSKDGPAGSGDTCKGLREGEISNYPHAAQ